MNLSQFAGQIPRKRFRRFVKSHDPEEPTDVIDLHMHTTASDGTCTPESLVERVWQAGIRTMSVTDHDTMASVAPATAAAAAYGMTVIPGIEITAVDGGRDVHVLAYFLSADAPGLQDLLDIAAPQSYRARSRDRRSTRGARRAY